MIAPLRTPSRKYFVKTRLVPVAGGGAEERAVLQFADDALGAFVALQRHVLRVLVANRAKAAAELVSGHFDATEPAV